MKIASLSTTLFALAGCTVMVNGKPRRIGGSDPQQPTAAAQAPASQPAAAPAPGRAPAPAPTARPGARAAAKVVHVDATVGRAPIVVAVDQFAFDTTFGKTHGSSARSPDCGNEMTSAPIASIEIKQPMESLEITVTGGSNDGFVLQLGDKYWFTCTQTTNQVPSIGKLAEGWQPGRYDIYPVTRYAGHAKHPFEVEVYDPSKPVVWTDAVKKLSLGGKLAKPMLVEVTTKAHRRKLRAEHAGWGCDKAAFADEPDLALTLERPIPGLVVRPLPSAVPVTLRKEQRDGKKDNRGCPNGGSSSNAGHPSYAAEHELHFGRDDEGTFGVSLGTADADKPTTVTLMIFDDSTKLEPLAAFPYAEAATLEQRWLGFRFPQLDLRELDASTDWAHAELASKLFALAPRDAFVYSKLDLDKDIASGASDEFPKKNEPLLVLGVENGRAEVLAADGLRFHVKATHLLLAPDGEAAPPTAPRAYHKLDIGRAIALLPPSAKPLAVAHERRMKAWEDCNDRVWEPYGRQLPTITRPAGVDVVTYESPRMRQIREAGIDAQIRTCGSEEAVEKKTEAERVAMLAEITKARAKLLAAATAH